MVAARYQSLYCHATVNRIWTRRGASRATKLHTAHSVLLIILGSDCMYGTCLWVVRLLVLPCRSLESHFVPLPMSSSVVHDTKPLL